MSQFYIASLKHTSKNCEHIIWWRPFHRGYTPVIERAGRYCFGEAVSLNEGECVIAIPVAAVDALWSSTPFYKPGKQFYDYAGAVVDNTKAIWTQLVEASLRDGRLVKPKPVAFRGAHRSFAWKEVA